MSAELIRCARCLMGVRVMSNRTTADQWKCPECRVTLHSGFTDQHDGSRRPVVVSIAPQDVERFPGHDPL